MYKMLDHMCLHELGLSMVINQDQNKLDKRAAALRDNLAKRKPVKKVKKPASDSRVGAGVDKDKD